MCDGIPILLAVEAGMSCNEIRGLLDDILSDESQREVLDEIGEVLISLVRGLCHHLAGDFARIGGNVGHVLSGRDQRFLEVLSRDVDGTVSLEREVPRETGTGYFWQSGQGNVKQGEFWGPWEAWGCH